MGNRVVVHESEDACKSAEDYRAISDDLHRELERVIAEGPCVEDENTNLTDVYDDEDRIEIYASETTADGFRLRDEVIEFKKIFDFQRSMQKKISDGDIFWIYLNGGKYQAITTWGDVIKNITK